MFQVERGKTLVISFFDILLKVRWSLDSFTAMVKNAKRHNGTIDEKSKF